MNAATMTAAIATAAAHAGTDTDAVEIVFRDGEFGMRIARAWTPRGKRKAQAITIRGWGATLEAALADTINEIDATDAFEATR